MKNKTIINKIIQAKFIHNITKIRELLLNELKIAV